MGFFDIFRSKPQAPRDTLSFTKEEQEVIDNVLAGFYRASEADTPAGHSAYVHPKVINAMKASALNAYVEDIMLHLHAHKSSQQTLVLLKKATNAQHKAWTLHNLPIYLFQLAGLCEMRGSTDSTKNILTMFLAAQREFNPDKIDVMFIERGGFDIEGAVKKAEKRLKSLESRGSKKST